MLFLESIYGLVPVGIHPRHLLLQTEIKAKIGRKMSEMFYLKLLKHSVMKITKLQLLH